MGTDDTTCSRAAIASYVDPNAFSRLTRAALKGLGYDVVQASAVGRFDDARWQPALRIVGDQYLGRLPSIDDDPDTPIVVVSGREPRPLDDARIVGHLLRPVRLSSLYPIIQSALETTPRGAPRVMTELCARIAHAGERFVSELDSLSVQGCHVREGRDIDLGTKLNIEFALPGTDPVLTRAACVTRGDDGVGLVFDSTDEHVRDSIDTFVTQRLASMPALALT